MMMDGKPVMTMMTCIMQCACIAFPERQAWTSGFQMTHCSHQSELLVREQDDELRPSRLTRPLIPPRLRAIYCTNLTQN